MFKNIISPVQAWFLSQGRCVGCGTPLSKGIKKNAENKNTVVCKKCGRIFLFNPETKRYQRAPLEINK
jgi:hypothetical protein